MKKKIMLVFFALVVLSLPYQYQHAQNVEAAVASKVGTLTAKKVAKEYIQDVAVQTTTNFALMQALEIVDNYEAKPGFKIVCPDGSQSCDKPIQVKENITDMDKQAIKGQAGLELDKMINGGKKLSKWQKFLDWFLPVWLVSFGATVLTYALDSDVRSFFNETAYNALVALGFIVPIETKEIIPIKDVVLTPVPSTPENEANGLFTQTIDFISWDNKVTDYDTNGTTMKDGFKDYAFNVNFTGDVDMNVFSMTYKNNKFIRIEGVNVRVAAPVDNSSTATVYKNGEYMAHVGKYSSSNNDFIFNATKVPAEIHQELSIAFKKVNSIRTRLPYNVGDFWYTDVLFDSVNGNIYELQVKHGQSGYGSSKIFTTEMIRASGAQYTATVFAQPNVSPIKKILVPVYDEVEQGYPHNSAIPKSNYEDNKGRVAIIPPVAIPLEEEGTGQQVIRVPAANGDGYEFQKPDGTLVPEENVTTGPDPVVTPSPGGQTYPNGDPIPQGTPMVTPTPTPQAPNPEPIPLTPDKTAPPGEGTGNPEPPAEPFPEGETCQEKFKFPIFSPLKETFSTSFPFSIPWDIGRAIDAAFSEIGNDKPEFEYTFKFGDTEETIKITTPKLFDNWKPFTDSLLLFTFDVLIMFGIYRFVKGGGS